MNKRLLALLSVLVLASMVLAACGTPAATRLPPLPLMPPPLQRLLPPLPKPPLLQPWEQSRSQLRAPSLVDNPFSVLPSSRVLNWPSNN